MIILLDNVCKQIDVKYYTSVTSTQRENITKAVWLNTASAASTACLTPEVFPNSHCHRRWQY